MPLEDRPLHAERLRRDAPERLRRDAPERLRRDAPDGEADDAERDDGVVRTRRSFVKIGVAAAALAAAAGAGSWFWVRAHARAGKESAVDLTQRSYAALREGAITTAVALAKRARELDPDSAAATEAWLHAVGIDLLEGYGDGARAVGFVYEARKLKLRGTYLAFATLTAAVAMRNDRFAKRLLDEHIERGIVPDAFYELAAGAAYDLDCDAAAAEQHFASSSALWVDAALPRLRRARSLLFLDRIDDAREVLAGITKGAERFVLEAALDRLEDRDAAIGVIDPNGVPDLLRSVRPLAQALLVSPSVPQIGLDAALGEIDSPLTAMACAKLAIAGGDRASAERAAAAAHEMRPEMQAGTALLVHVRLMRGDLVGAHQLAFTSGETEISALVDGIAAYEDRKLSALHEAAEHADSASVDAWPLSLAAAGLLGEGPKPDLSTLLDAMERDVPWADVLLVDAALDEGELELVDYVMETWTESTAPRERRRKRVAERRNSPDKP